MDRYVNTEMDGNISPRVKFYGTISPNFDPFKPSTIDAELIYEETGIVQRASAQFFPSFSEAKQCYLTLDIVNLKNKHVAKPLLLLKRNNHGLVFTERLISMRQFLNTVNNILKRGGVVDFTPEFLRVLEQILDGLRALHAAGYRHGRLLEGVYFAEDFTVRLCYFKPSKDHGTLAVSEIVADLVAVRSLCKLAERADFPTSQSEKLALFYQFFDFEEYKILEIDNSIDSWKVITKFIYLLPLMRNPTAIGLLFCCISDLEDPKEEEANKIDEERLRIIKTISFKKYLKKNWGKELEDERLIRNYWFPWPVPSEKEMRQATTKPSNLSYLTERGFAHFARNVEQHCARNVEQHCGRCIEDGVDVLLGEFPCASLMCYLEMLRSELLRSTIVVRGEPTEFQEYVCQVLMVGNVAS